MKLALGHGLAGLALLAGGVATFVACQHDDSSLFVQNVIYPTPVGTGQACTYTADPSQTFLAHGRLDVGLAAQYSAVFLLGNQLVAESNSQQLQTETSTINVQSAIVQDSAADGTQLDYFTYDVGGAVYPSTGTVPGYAAMGPVVILSEKAVNSVVAFVSAKPYPTETLIANVKFTGHTLGGTYVESNVFQYAIDACFGCLVAFSPMEIAPSCTNSLGQIVPLQEPNCFAFSATSSTGSTTFPCFLGQDTGVDCSACQGFPVCNGRAYTNGYPCGIADAGTGG